jgi:hypothetical protein
MRKRYNSIMTLHECISFTLQSMNSDRKTEIENLKKAVDSARKSLVMLIADLTEAEMRRPDPKTGSI